ncbi:hypothetical protein C8R45DRAFT_1139016 [Mycena sanguinolenta]|nr:hypothetical protein C8R45DRAFT_1139016 [Mycena sanguinolenta]
MSDYSVPATFVQRFPTESNSDLGDMDKYELEMAPGPLVAGPLIGQRSRSKQFEFWAFLSKLRGPAELSSLGSGPCPPSYIHIHDDIHGAFAVFVLSITLRLRGEGMSLAEFISGVKISTRSLILDAQNGRWSALSMAVLLLTVVQTSCQINFEVPLRGHEINLMNSDLQSLQSTGALDYCMINTRQTESGYAALKGDVRLAASLTLMDQTFNLSTGGILFQIFEPLVASSWFTGRDITEIPANIESLIEVPKSLMFSSSTVRQQGLTADVSCEFQDLPASTTVQVSTAQDWNGALQPTANVIWVFFSRLGIDAEGHTVSSNSFLVFDPPSYISMVACGGDSTYTLIFQGVGIYSFMRNMVCTVAPKVTSVQVDYSDTGTINSTRLTDGEPADVTGPAGLTARFAQGTSNNVMGDEIRALIEEVDPEFQDSSVTFAVEAYIRGVTEYSGSVLRGCLTAPNGAFTEGVPTNMAMSTDGVLYGQIVGWLEISFDTFYVMIPGTLVAIATIWIVLTTLAHHSGDPEGESFNPANTMHIVAASAAGGLQNVFTGTEVTALKGAEDVHVVLQSLAGGPPALYVQAGMV